MSENTEQKSGFVLENFIPQLKKFLESETVFGEPYHVDGITLIPVQSVKVGFGFGGKTPDVKQAEEKTIYGGSGGVSISPVAMVIIKNGYVSVQSLNQSDLEGILEKIPDFLDKLIALTKKNLPKKENES